jgi:hypothetical protein
MFPAFPAAERAAERASLLAFTSDAKGCVSWKPSSLHPSPCSAHAPDSTRALTSALTVRVGFLDRAERHHRGTMPSVPMRFE